MLIIASILWVLIWGAAGYFTVRAILMHFKKKRIEKAMANRCIMQHELHKYAGKFYTIDVENLFGDLLTKDKGV